MTLILLLLIQLLLKQILRIKWKKSNLHRRRKVIFNSHHCWFLDSSNLHKYELQKYLLSNTIISIILICTRMVPEI